MTTPDVKRMAPLWLKYSEDVRMDPEVLYPGMCYILACIFSPDYLYVLGTKLGSVVLWDGMGRIRLIHP